MSRPKTAMDANLRSGSAAKVVTTLAIPNRAKQTAPKALADTRLTRVPKTKVANPPRIEFQVVANGTRVESNSQSMNARGRCTPTVPVAKAAMPKAATRPHKERVRIASRVLHKTSGPLDGPRRGTDSASGSGPAKISESGTKSVAHRLGKQPEVQRPHAHAHGPD